MRLNEELENTRGILSKVTIESQNIQQSANKAEQQNTQIKTELAKLKACLRSQVNYSTMRGINY